MPSEEPLRCGGAEGKWEGKNSEQKKMVGHLMEMKQSECHLKELIFVYSVIQISLCTLRCVSLSLLEVSSKVLAVCLCTGKKR